MGSKLSKESRNDTSKKQSTHDSYKDDSSAMEVGNQVVNMILDGVMLYGIWVTAKYVYKTIKPRIDDLRGSNCGRTKLHQQLLRSGRPVFPTSYYEDVISGDIVDPYDISITFNDIGGLEQQKRDIYDLVVLPLKCPHFFSARGKLLSVPKGILLYGQPGTGKTMLAKAIAKESGAFFIDLKMSTVMSKWFGESQKMIRAAFSLATKLAPCIIFIDEVESFMGKRGGVSDPTYSSMKTEFLALWDGFTDISSSDLGYGVIVLGATNRPADVDPAFLRRMPRTFKVGLPDKNQREKILKLHLQNEELESGFDFDRLSLDTDMYSGSDLKELCRAALMIPLREYLENAKEGYLEVEGRTADLRPLCIQDFKKARHMVQASCASASAYDQQDELRNSGKGSEFPMNPDMFAYIMASGLQQMMNMHTPKSDAGF